MALFLASPGDVVEERALVRKIVEEINSSVAKSHGWVIDVVAWETDSYPAFGSDGQQTINDQIVNMDIVDIFVGIFWNRFGTKTPRANSGTEEEAVIAIDSWRAKQSPHIMFYFRNQTLNSSSEEELVQKSKVVAFRNSIQEHALYSSYSNVEEFAIRFRQHLIEYLTRLAKTGVETKSADRKIPITDASDQTEWAMLGDDFFKIESFTERSGEVTIVLRSSSAKDEAGLRKSLEKVKRVKFAFRDIGKLLEVVSFEFSTSGHKGTWSIEAKTLPSASYFQEMTVNGVSPDKIAELRARLILLSDEVADGGLGIVASVVRGHLGQGELVESDLLPNLWKKCEGNRSLFLSFARLVGVYYLKMTHTVEEIDTLIIGPFEKEGVRVEFVGRRPRFYNNVDPKSISITGICPLN